MRASCTGEAGVVFDKSLDNIQAFCLGYDYCSEHEVGIKDLLSKLGTNPKKLGLEAYQITKSSLLTTIGQVETKDGPVDVYVITSAKDIKIEYLVNILEHKYHEDDYGFDFWTAWGEDDFLIVMQKTEMSMKVYNTLIEAFDKNDIAVYQAGSGNPFGGSGLVIAVYSKIPKEAIKQSIIDRKERDQLNAKMGKSKAITALKIKQDEWKKTHSGSYLSTPWDHYALSSPRIQGLGLVYWLNPAHQNAINSGWVNDKDIWEWVHGIPGKIIMSKELWDEVIYECSVPKVGIISYNLHRFNMYEPKYQPGPGSYVRGEGDTRIKGTKMPKALNKDNTLTEAFIKYVEQHLLYWYLNEYEEQLRYGEKSITDITHPRREFNDQIHGFFTALRFMGYETQSGASNVPACRENFSWWRGLIEEEAYWRFLIKHGKAYEPWVKNGYSEATKNRYLAYKNSKWNDDTGQELSIIGRKLKEA
jgi:hypothetical protein